MVHEGGSMKNISVSGGDKKVTTVILVIGISKNDIMSREAIRGNLEKETLVELYL